MLQLLSFGKKKIKNTLNIYVKSNRGTLNIDLSPQMEVKDLKSIVAPKLGLECDQIKIIFAGKELLDNTLISVSH
jgi:parkin